jgi:long-chain acyl-CoA synthetase
VKLSHGEYVALEKLEAQYKSVPAVLNLVIHADPLESYIIALVVPIEHEIKAIAGSLQISGTYDTLCANPAITEHVMHLLIESAKKANFKGAELVKQVTLLSDEWTAENGMLTAAQKIKRKEVIAKYTTHIDRMYGRKK